MRRHDIHPVDFMYDMLNDPNEELGNRLWAAEKLAPYAHSKAIEYHDSTNHEDKSLMDEIADLEREIAAPANDSAPAEPDETEPVPMSEIFPIKDEKTG